MGAWTEIVDYTVPSNTTSVVLNDFGTITKDDFIKVVFTIKHSSATGLGINLFANTATSETGYHRQQLRGIGSSATAARSTNLCRPFFTLGETVDGYAVAYLKLSENDKFNIFALNQSDGSSVDTAFSYVTCETSFTSGIDTLTFTHTGSGITIAAGSRIQIYRLDAEKVRDITVTSNSTQVDIPVTGSLDPAITKDSEYLLVSDIDNNTGQGIAYSLTVNDSTTLTNYNAQRIIGDGSSATAERRNDALFTSAVGGTKSLNYTNIKLSEIGSFTYQSYNIRDYGSTTPLVQNSFGSSTSEAITSITKLNLVSPTTNGIASGSRFILYKLK
jgi:hypothetical protein